MLFPVSPSPAESAKVQPRTSEQARLLQDMRLAAILTQACDAQQQQPASTCVKLQGFDDPQLAFSAKSTGQLLQSLAVFRTCSVKPLVQNADVLLAAAKKVVGQSLVTSVVHHTFFKHFCGGATLCLPSGLPAATNTASGMLLLNTSHAACTCMLMSSLGCTICRQMLVSRFPSLPWKLAMSSHTSVAVVSHLLPTQMT